MLHQHKSFITQWNQNLRKKIFLQTVISSDLRGEKFWRFAQELSQLAPNIVFQKITGEIPSIHTDFGLYYQAIPTGRELEPFLEALNLSSSALDCTAPQALKIRTPTKLELYILPECSFCPQVVRQLTPLVATNDLIELTIVDCSLFPEFAENHQIQSTPTLVWNQTFRWCGVLNLEEVISVLAKQDPSQIHSHSLQDMLTQGQASQVAQMMLSAGKIFPSFLKLLIHEKWDIRLGAMVTIEEIIEKNFTLACQVKDFLWENFYAASDSVKGDILYILGSIGGTTDIIPLQRILKESYTTDIQEAAQEALEKIMNLKKI